MARSYLLSKEYLATMWRRDYRSARWEAGSHRAGVAVVTVQASDDSTWARVAIRGVRGR